MIAFEPKNDALVFPFENTYYMQKIDIKNHLRDPKYYNRDRDMEVALVWNAVKKFLVSRDRSDLFTYIKSIKIAQKTIIITTNKPLINSELSSLRETLHESICTALGSIHPSPQALEKLIFR